MAFDENAPPHGIILCTDDDTRPRPEDVTDEERDAILERALDGAAEQARRDRARRVAAGLVDENGNILRPTAKPATSDDGGGW
jgi:hypothetical protein